MADILQITYHPAKKEIKFKRYTEGKDNDIPVKDLNDKYAVGEKGKFILQDHGNKFFSDIAKTFDGQETVKVNLVTTKVDYEDFLQMLEEYNKTPSKDHNCTITVTSLVELPDMKETFSIVEKHGKDSALLLGDKVSDFSSLATDKSNIKKTIEDVKNTLENERIKIETQVKELSDNDVALCFAGVYSAGKSTLVNALLGYAILPEAIKSSTAKMFKIRTPKESENIRISFQLDNFDSQIVWQEDKKVLDWVTGPTENDTRKEIQEVINTNKDKPRHIQICELLRKLNHLEKVDSEIDILFPVPLDDENVQFTIYDTPGSDSNVEKHQLILQEALNDQKKSILILVAAPDKLEGEGNNALLTYIKKAEKAKNNKTCIDLGRSLFVINKIETVQKSDEKKSLKTGELKNKKENNEIDKEFSIQLEDKKLLFVSAQEAYKAKAIKNNLIDADPFFEAFKNIFFNPETGQYYQFDQCGSSEFATKKLIERADAEFKKADKEKDDIRKYLVSSGLFSIEQEIKNYGIKYASAVRAYAIIKSVEGSLEAVNHQVAMLKGKSEEELERIKNELAQEKDKLIKEVKDICEKHRIQNNEIPDEFLSKLEISPSYFKSCVDEKAQNVIDSVLKKAFIGKTTIEKTQEQRIQTEIQGLTTSYLSNYSEKRESVLQEMSKCLTNEVKNAVMGNEHLSEKTKEILSAVKQPDIPEFNVAQTVKNLFEELVEEKHHSLFWGLIEWNTRKIDIEKFGNDLRGTLSTIQRGIHDNCTADFKKTTTFICDSIDSSFNENIDTYSDRVNSMLNEKETMEKLCSMLESLENDLLEKQNELDKKIWEVKKCR